MTPCFSNTLRGDLGQVCWENNVLTYSPFLPVEAAVIIPTANDLTTCISLCKNDVDCFAMERVQNVCYHRKLTCQYRPNPQFGEVAFNVTYKPLDDPTGSHLNDTSLLKICSRKPTSYTDNFYYMYLQMNRKSCLEGSLPPDLCLRGDYQYAIDFDS